MSAPRDQRFWGWGVDEDAGHGLPEAAEGLLSDELGVPPGISRPPIVLEAIELPEPAPVALEGIELRDDREARVLHAAGKSYPDLVRQRAGAASAPDAVAFPRTHEEVAALLA